MGLIMKILEEIAYGVGYAESKIKYKLRKRREKKNESDSSSTDNSYNEDDEVSYEIPKVTKSQIIDKMHCVSKYTMENNVAKVDLERYTINENYDGSFDIDVYFKGYPLSNFLEEFEYVASVQRCAERLMNNIYDWISSLGCGFKIIPHIEY